MATRLHTAVGDEIRRIEQTDPELASEMRFTSWEYREEVMGHYDEEYDPYDERDGHEYEPESEDDTDHCCECGAELLSGNCPNSNCPVNDGEDN